MKWSSQSEVNKEVHILLIIAISTHGIGDINIQLLLTNYRRLVITICNQ
jgi:hypothetical protein